MKNTAAFAGALGDILAAADTLAAVDNAAVHTAVAGTVGILAAVGSSAAAAADSSVAAADSSVAAVDSSVVAHGTVFLDTAGTVVAVGFAGVHLHPCKHGPLLLTAYRTFPLSSSLAPALLPRESPGA